jgi:hypothetical protein
MSTNEYGDLAMRLADLVHPMVTTTVETIVELDPMGLRLSRYLGSSAAVGDGGEPGQEFGPETLVLATVRAGRRLDDDLRDLAAALTGATDGVIVTICFEDDYENLPLPRLTRFLDENGLEAARLSETPYSRVRTGLVGTVRRAAAPDDEGRAEFAAVLRLRNDVVLGDFEMRRLSDRIEELTARTPATVAVASPVVPTPATDAGVQQLEQRVRDLTDQMQRLREQRDLARERMRAANRKLRGLRESATFRVGRSIVQAPRHPSQLAKLPAELMRSYRNRNSAPRLAPTPAVTAAPTILPKAAAMARGLPGRGGSAAKAPKVTAPTGLPGGIGAVTSTAGVRLRVAVAGRPSLVRRLATGADVVTLQGGAWRPAEASLPPVDLVLIDANVGRTPSSWTGLGEPGEVDRLRDLVRLLDEAAARQLPSILLVDGTGIPAGLRGIEARVAAVVAWSSDSATGWDPGVALADVPWPSGRPRTAPLLRVGVYPAPPNQTAEHRWLSALPLRSADHWLIGVRSRRIVDPLLGVDSAGHPTLPLPALAERPAVLLSGAQAGWLAREAAAAGCHVLSRLPIDGIEASPSLTVAEDPRRARSLLEAGLGQPSAADVFTFLFGLLRRGAVHERMAALADLAGLPVAGILHRQVGVSAVAVVRTDEEGRRFASELSVQTRLPEDLTVVDLTESPNGLWLGEVRATGVATTMLTDPAIAWSDLAAQVLRDRIVVWPGDRPWSPRAVAELELLAHRRSGEALSAGWAPDAPIDRHALLACIAPVTHRPFPTSVAADAVANGAA